MQKRKYLLGAVLFLAFGVVGYFSMRLSKSRAGALVSPIVEVPAVSIPTESTASAVPVASQSAILAITLTPSTISATPKALPTPAKTPTPSPTDSREINEFIDRFSAQFGIDPNVLRHVALCESGFNSNATNGPYIGLFQFDSITWKNIRKEIGEDTSPTLRFAAKDAVQTAAYALSKGKSKLWPNCVP